MARYKGLFPTWVAQAVALLLLFAIIILTGPASAAGTQYDNSGVAKVPKLTKTEIAKLLYETEFKAPSAMWDSTPTYNPYAAGRVKNAVLQDATDRLNALRLLAGLQPVALNSDLSQEAQYGAVLLAAEGLPVTTPMRPQNMTDAFYTKALTALKNSVSSTNDKFGSVVDAWVQGEHDTSVDITSRRWALSPAMAYVGFGYAERTADSWWLYKNFSTMYATNTSATSQDYQFIGWPASGYFPVELFPSSSIWSIQLNPNKYSFEDLKDVQVAMTRVADNKSWVFYDGVQQTGLDFYVTVDSIGTGSCISFRPDDISKYVGVYKVKVSGLKDLSGNYAELEYTVEFFDAVEYKTSAADPSPSPTTPAKPDSTLPPRDPNKDPSPTVTTPVTAKPAPQLITPPANAQPVSYADVSSTHWAVKYIEKATQHGVVMGVGDNNFSPSRSVTGYEFGAILLRALYGQELAKVVDTDPWWLKVDSVGTTCGLWSGLSSMNRSQPITRYQMATMIVNATRGTRLNTISAKDSPGITNRFFDWSTIPTGYQDDVATCVYWGILEGMGEGYFNGTSYMDRAQAATVYSRLYDVLYKYR